MVAERLTEEDLAGRSSEIVEGIRTGKRNLVLIRNTVIGEINRISEKAGITLRDLAAELVCLPPLDDDLAADVKSRGCSFSRESHQNGLTEGPVELLNQRSRSDDPTTIIG